MISQRGPPQTLITVCQDMALSHLNLLRPVLCRFLPSVVRSPLLTSSRVPSLPHTSCPALLPNYVRHYATKKSKAKAKGQTAKVNINAALVEDIISLEEVKEDMAAVLATLKEDFSRNLSIRTSPGQDLPVLPSLLLDPAWFLEANMEVKQQVYYEGQENHLGRGNKVAQYRINVVTRCLGTQHEDYGLSINLPSEDIASQRHLYFSKHLIGSVFPTKGSNSHHIGGSSARKRMQVLKDQSAAQCVSAVLRLLEVWDKVSSVPWDQALTAPHGASYTTHSTPLPRSLELHHGEMLPSSSWIKEPRVGCVCVCAMCPQAMAAVTRALQDSSMGLNPEVEGTIIRVPVPRVTREHRENLVKLAKQFSNKAKDSLRKVRTNAVTRVKKSKEGVSEDTIHLIEKQIQQMADGYVADIDKQLATKTKELLG
ncbi:ribosome-recycling factor, mitochondrial-like [Sinocyclocheilus rhinocerous]|uniref:ribosome-recycling factor, mitochondrial-like n=1 Tax=Sinocyclocheilus rhinocerous TaxID=307959 RepID=UPI0007BA30ED|nr:PREDICTED: ribosome-recycling factor, mitochondrial-like [Sinocyclocheilus rhinocerous]